MNTYLVICGKKLNLLSAILATIAFIILILLGNWQIQRLGAKNHFIKTIEHNVTHPAISIEDFNGTPANYSKVKLSGSFLPGKNIFLYGRRSASPEKDGYYLLSAFKDTNDNIYMVSRGWVPQSVKNNIGSLVSSEDLEMIEAIILPGESKNFFVPENDKTNNIWFNIDLNMAVTSIGTNITDFYLMQIDADNLPEGAKPLSVTHLNKVRNDHLEYAITWYSLAACLLLMFVLHVRKQNL